MDRKATGQCCGAEQKSGMKRRSQQMLNGGLPIREGVMIAWMGKCRHRRYGEKRSDKYSFHSAISP